WNGLFALFGYPDSHAVEQQDAEHDSVLDGFAEIGLYQPCVMHYSQDPREIDQAVQAQPVFAAEATNRPCRRGQGQGNHEDEGRESYGDEGTLGDVFQHFVDVEELVEPDVGGEMETTVEECEQSDHAAYADQPVLTGDPAERRDGEGGEDEDERPVSGRVRDELDGIGAQAGMKGPPCQAFQRNQGGQEDRDFGQTQGH